MENDDTSMPVPVAKIPILTYVLLALTIVVYLVDHLLALRTSLPLFFVLGAKINESIVQGQYWRLVTPIFLHGGVVHLAVNAYSLYAIGPDVEIIFGKVKFLVIYLVAGLLGNIASFAFCPAVSVGASGALFGLLGALLYMAIIYKEELSREYVINIIIMIVLNLGYGLLHTQIDNYAHMGGLVGGYLTAYCLGLGYIHHRWTIQKTMALLVLGGLIMGGLFLGFQYPAVS